MKYLSEFEQIDDSAKEEASKTVIEAIKLPNLYQLDDLLDLPAVKELEKDSKYAKLYQLLSIFVHDTLEEFRNFANSNSDFVKSLGL